VLTTFLGHVVDRVSDFGLTIRPVQLSGSTSLCYYNFCRIHQTLRVTPALAAGITTRVWEIADIVALWDAQQEKAA
jgi:hypothetical protein